MKAVPGPGWSRTLRSWLIPDTEENRVECALPLKIDSLPSTQIVMQQSQVVKANTLPEVLYITENNREELDRFMMQLLLKAYSKSTLRTYKSEFCQLLQKLGNHKVQTLTAEQLKRYFIYCLKQELSENTIHSRINAVKFYFEQVLHKDQIFIEIPRPKKPLQLPKVLGQDELHKLFKVLTNIKHKAILSLLTALG